MLLIFLALPFLLAGLAVGLVGLALGTRDAAAALVARPFLRAVERWWRC